MMELRTQRMEQALQKLRIILQWQRSGLLNLISSVSKTLFGILDGNNFTLVNQNIDKFFDSQNRLTHIVQN